MGVVSKSFALRRTLRGQMRFLASFALFFIFHLSSFISSPRAQDLDMRRTNSVGPWLGFVNNNGILFNQQDSVHPLGEGSGGFWMDPNNFQDTLIFGAGIWFGGKRNVGGSLIPHVEFAYEPNHSGSQFVPGSLLYDGAPIDSSQPGRDKYRVYRSTDLAGPAWPVRLVNGKPAYIDDPSQRMATGPKAVMSDEDVFIVYKDSDPSASSDTDIDPFGIEIRSQVCFWGRGSMKDVMLVHNQLLYLGKDTIFNPVIGVCIDGDVQFPNDDRVKTVMSEGPQTSVFYTDSSLTDPLFGVMALPNNYGSNHPPVAVSTIRYWELEEDPVTDSDRYARLSEGGIQRATTRTGDARALIAIARNEPLAPGDTLQFDFALYAAPGKGTALTPDDTLRMIQFAEVIAARYYSNNLHESVQDVHQAGAGLFAFPNPAGDKISVYGVGNESVRLLDALGIEVGRIQLEDGQGSWNMAALPSGLYFLKDSNSSYKVSVIR